MSKVELASGTLIDILDPNPNDFKLRDICHGLKNLCRFGGHTNRFYSVLEHTINCYHEAVSRGYEFNELKVVYLHDFSESLGLSDIPSPVKKLLTNYNSIEENFQNKIYKRFGAEITDESIAKLHEVDYDVAIYEARYLMPCKGEDDRWSPPTKQEPCQKVKRNLTNKSCRQSYSLVEEFYYLCEVLEIYQ